MSELLMERRKSAKAFIGQYLAAIALGVGLAILCFLIPGFGVFSPVGILPLVFVVARSYLARISECYRLYTDRLEIESGLLARRIENVELFRIRDVGLRQGLFGMLGNFGDVYVHSTDSSTPAMHIRGIDTPKAFYEQIRQRVSDSRAQHRTMIIEEGREIAEP
jgi:uncharacterized membrane protein YdbT with pleckstrin-like domain